MVNGIYIQLLQSKQILKVTKQKIILHKFQVSELVGFTDGAWHKEASGVSKAGIEGFLLRDLYHWPSFFSGPVITQSSLDAEKEGFVFYIQSNE